MPQLLIGTGFFHYSAVKSEGASGAGPGRLRNEVHLIVSQG